MSTSGVVPEADMQRFRNRTVGRRIKEQTFTQYRSWIQRFELWRPTSHPDLGTVIDFDSFLQDPGRTDYPWENLRGRPSPDQYAHSTRILAISAIKLWLRLQYDERIEDEPQNIASGEPEPFEPHYLSHRDVEQVFHAAGHSCNAHGCEAAVRLTYDAVLRASELALITRDDVDFKNGVVDVTATKGSHDSKIQVEDSTLQALREAAQEGESGALFENTYGRRWKANAWATHFRRKHHPAGAHSFGRHTPIVHMMNSGTSFGDVYRRARHRHPDMTARYARFVGTDVPDWAGE